MYYYTRATANAFISLSAISLRYRIFSFFVASFIYLCLLSHFQSTSTFLIVYLKCLTFFNETINF